MPSVATVRPEPTRRGTVPQRTRTTTQFGIDARTEAARTMLGIPKGMPLTAWRELGKQINLIANSSAWWLGDWLLYGQSEYPDRYKTAVTETQLDYQTLRNYAWVARRFPPESRHSKVSFQHHAEVASLGDREQDAWLTQAELGGWSRNELRRRIRTPSRELAAPDNVEVQVKVNLAAPQKDRWQNAADLAEQDLPTWIVSVLDHAARSALDSGQPA